MTDLPDHGIRVYGAGDELPVEVEKLFQKELASSRKASGEGTSHGSEWQFACVCAVAGESKVLGGVHFDMGPIGSGPLARDRVAILEEVIVESPYRQQGLGTSLLRRALEVARDAGCVHVRCNARWDNPAEIALYRKCGFALADINEPGEEGYYFVVKPLAE